MLILFVLLALQIMPPQWVNPGCNILIRYMALLFVPIGVGVMQYWICCARSSARWWSPARSARWWSFGGELELTSGSRRT
jgi:putative effector of murein hydrolase LrgA (UPF0299 family)